MRIVNRRRRGRATIRLQAVLVLVALGGVAALVTASAGDGPSLGGRAPIEGRVVGYWVRWDTPGQFTGLTFAIVPKIAPIA